MNAEQAREIMRKAHLELEKKDQERYDALMVDIATNAKRLDNCVWVTSLSAALIKRLEEVDKFKVETEYDHGQTCYKISW